MIFDCRSRSGTCSHAHLVFDDRKSVIGLAMAGAGRTFHDSRDAFQEQKQAPFSYLVNSEVPQKQGPPVLANHANRKGGSERP